MNCRTCKHWDQAGEEDENIGRCLGIAKRVWGELDRVPAILSNEPMNVDFVTHGQFGCTCHEAKVGEFHIYFVLPAVPVKVAE